MKLHIKYMVSNRCKMAVKEILKKHDLHFVVVDLGEVEIMENLSAMQREQLKSDLVHSGFELMDDHNGIIIKNIKDAIHEMIETSGETVKTNLSDYLTKKLNLDYAYMANLFSEVQGSTVEQFMIQHKIERIKEMLLHNELNITEIAWRMNYSSVAHLSNQFKKHTGLSPSGFKQLKSNPHN